MMWGRSRSISIGQVDMAETNDNKSISNIGNLMNLPEVGFDRIDGSHDKDNKSHL